LASVSAERGGAVGLDYCMILSLFFPKRLPQIVVAMLVWIFCIKREMVWRVAFFCGLFIPLFIFGVWIVVVSHGWNDIQTIIYSLANLSRLK